MGLFDGSGGGHGAPPARAAEGRAGPHLRARATLALAVVLLCFTAVGAQLLRLGLMGGGTRARIAFAEAPISAWARPDIVDRNGRLLATDRVVSSLYADPQLVQDIEETVGKVAAVLPGINAVELRKALADRSRRFAWVARALTPEEAQVLRGIGLPGLGLRSELRRDYPLGPLAGHVLGTVSIDNRGLAGIERLLDETGLVEPARGAERSAARPVRLALDLGVQHAVAEELRRGLQQFKASAAAAVVIDARTGEIVAAVSLPEIDPNRPGELLDGARLDRLTGGTFELGSVYKILTIALAL